MGSIGGETRYLDCPELTKIIVSRIQMVDPENAMKIMGCICLNETKDEMKQLAFSSDNILLSKINDAKAVLSPKTPVLPHQHNPFPLGSRSFSSPATSLAPGALWGSDRHGLRDNLEFSPCSYDSVLDEYFVQKQARYLNLDDQLDPGNATSCFYYHDAALGNCMDLNSRAVRRTPSLPEFPIKPCHYFSKGYCKHGENCRYFHGTTTRDGYSQLFSHNSNEYMNDDIGFSPGSLEKLEMEITELLRSKRGMPVSIASLPMLYFEKYGKNLQAEGYLTESQRHGKAGFSLTKLLARLKTSIRLIDRPHGQHSVILAEDALRFMECRNERSEGAIVSSSHQIYLTFPAESTFTEEDVSNYFKQYGHVHDVRIPCQDKRMFGFVSFLSPETVNLILMKRNPHYICGARVLVKPYREKTRPIDRTYMEKIKLSMYHPTHYLEMDTEIHATPRELDSSRLIRKHLIEEQERLIEHERMLELERMHISEFSLLPKPFTQQPYFSFGMEENKAQESGEFPMENHFSYMNDVLNCCSTSDDKARNASSNNAGQENGQIPELPDSPFASPPPVTSNIFTIT